MDPGEGEEGEGRMYGESNIEIYITICKIDNQWEFAVWLRECKPGLGNNLERWDREEGGIGRKVGGKLKKEGTWVNLWLIHTDVWYNTVKQLFFN